MPDPNVQPTGHHRTERARRRRPALRVDLSTADAARETARRLAKAIAAGKLSGRGADALARLVLQSIREFEQVERDARARQQAAANAAPQPIRLIELRATRD